MWLDPHQLVSSNMFKPSNNVHTDRFKAVLHLWILFCYLCFMFGFVLLSCLAALWSPALLALLALLCVMFTSVFVTFPYGVLCQVWYLIALIPDLCILPYIYDMIIKCPNLKPAPNARGTY